MMILDLRITHYAQVVANFTQGSYLYWDYILNFKLMFYCYRYISTNMSWIIKEFLSIK